MTIVDPTGQEITAKAAPAVIDVKAAGSQIIVEHLTSQEILGTNLIVEDEMAGTPHQAYIVDIGPAVDTKNWGFEVGSRVVLQGKFVPIPMMSESGRLMGSTDPSSVKVILVEA